MGFNDASENDIVLKVTWHDQSPANLLLLTGQWLERQNPLLALQYYESALQIEPNLTLAAWRYGYLALKQKLPQQAKEKLETSLPYLPDHAPTYYVLSLICDELGEEDSAFRYISQALIINPLHSGAFLHKMRLLAKGKRWQELKTFLAQDVANLESSGEVLLYRVLSKIHTGHKEEAQNDFKILPIKLQHRFPELTKHIASELSD